MNLRGYRADGIPYRKVVKAGGTPFLKPSSVIVVGETTLMKNVPRLYAPWSWLSLDTKRIKIVPDEGIPHLIPYDIYANFTGRQEIQELHCFCPKAGGDVSRAENFASKSMPMFNDIVGFLQLSEASGKGPLTVILPDPLGASSTGWIKLNLMLLNGLSQILGGHREIHSVGLVQVSTDLIGFDIDKRKEVAWRLIQETEISMVISYPRMYFGGSWINDQDLAREKVNQCIVFCEHLYSSKASSISRQPSDLKAILYKFGGAAYIPSAVMTPDEYGEVLRNPSEVKFLSPIPIALTHNTPCVLSVLAPSEGLAQNAVSSFQKTFANCEVVACYENEPSEGESRYMVLVPINKNELEKALNQAGKRDYAVN